MTKKRDRFADAIALSFWTYNAAVKDADGVVRIVGRTSREQEPNLDKLERKLRPCNG